MPLQSLCTTQFKVWNAVFVPWVINALLSCSFLQSTAFNRKAFLNLVYKKIKLLFFL